MMKTLLILVLCSAALVVCHRATADTDIYLGGWSVHLINNGERESNHNLVAMRYGKFFVGSFTNSHGDNGAVALYNIYRKDWEGVTARVGVGLNYGYGGCDGREGNGNPVYCPAAAAELQYTRYRIKPSLIWVGNAVILSFAISL